MILGRSLLCPEYCCECWPIAALMVFTFYRHQGTVHFLRFFLLAFYQGIDHGHHQLPGIMPPHVRFYLMLIVLYQVAWLCVLIDLVTDQIDLIQNDFGFDSDMSWAVLHLQEQPIEAFGERVVEQFLHFLMSCPAYVTKGTVLGC